MGLFGTKPRTKPEMNVVDAALEGMGGEYPPDGPFITEHRFAGDAEGRVAIFVDHDGDAVCLRSVSPHPNLVTTATRKPVSRGEDGRRLVPLRIGPPFYVSKRHLVMFAAVEFANGADRKEVEAFLRDEED